MAIQYTVLPQYSAIVVRMTGEVSLEAFLKHLKALISDPSVPNDHVTLLDARAVTRFHLSPDDIQAIAEFTKLHPSKIIARQLAIVIRGQRESELARRYEKLASSFQEKTIVFFNIDVARKWLGLPKEP